MNLRRKFPASKVRITRVYLVDCDECGERVDDSNAGHGDPSKSGAEQTRDSHVEWHRREQALATSGPKHRRP